MNIDAQDAQDNQDETLLHEKMAGAMIRALSIEWNLPADVLVREYDLTNTVRNVDRLQTVGKSSSHG